jgi:hypothetical protein
MSRVVCVLPPLLRSFCETGCIYRHPIYKHMACRLLPKQAPCVAPCGETCPCTPPSQNESRPKSSRSSTNEVRALQETRVRQLPV